MLNKMLLVLVCLMALATCQPFYTRPDFFVGNSTKWTAYLNGIYTDVNTTSLGLKKIPAIATTLSCWGSCWAVTGATSLYNLTPNGFRVYLRFAYPTDTLTVAYATNNFALNFFIFSLD
jgi:hypothetical protein